MPSLLTVPNWSFGRNRLLLNRFEQILEAHGVTIHYLRGDVDHNRTVSAFSGEEDAVLSALMDLADAAFETIDLNRHTGVHPRIGALDVCPFVAVDLPLDRAIFASERFGAMLSARHRLPVYLYEKSERGRHEADLPALRKGGFGGLIGRTLNPDFGPSSAHPRLGVSVVGVREFLIAMNVDLREPDPTLAKRLASEIRRLRADGDARFLGVRALGFPLASRNLSQVSLNLTLPDLTPVDPIVEWVMREAESKGVAIEGTELIGVIRPGDLPGASRLDVKPEQVVGGS